ncbi:preprotein translocase subunit YajC [Vreelandella populi]|uniref:Preprotein translocase subunit YajC n=1 Tax=Vreelandella populi TaxID=2498858 RepID=A0A3S0YQ61_9GAMM|nr:preprotein translocase subunit YajC [Halomonas populi]RUR40953.1 preprotein translocase subunit YajC [Halomonas populi]RUR49465.1 preprotein translocase subunit YajC [Halomonas populi]RUR55948.1 preprotein translocase subunit YajC [Halomonas populi]
MEWLIIGFVLMFVMAPVMWLKPSPRQKRQGTLRARAADEGASVKLEKPPLHHFKGTMPAYRWYYPQEAPGPDFLLVRDSHASSALDTYCAGWRWRIAPLRPLPESAAQMLQELLERLPQDALVVESTPNGLTLWWWESQTAERFSVYAAAFNQLRSTLGGLADQSIKTSTSSKKGDVSSPNQAGER